MSIVLVVERDWRGSEEIKSPPVLVPEILCGLESVDKDRAATLDLSFYTMEELNMRGVFEVPGVIETRSIYLIERRNKHKNPHKIHV
jgi:hypothetical protein